MLHKTKESIYFCTSELNLQMTESRFIYLSIQGYVNLTTTKRILRVKMLFYDRDMNLGRARECTCKCTNNNV